MKKVRLNKRGKQVVAAFFIILIIILMLLVFAGIKLYEKYSPTKERMSHEDYFEMQSQDQVLIYLNDEKLDSNEIKVLVEDGRCYLPREYVVDNLNCRFYKDIAGNYIMFTVADNIYSFATDEAYYTDMSGNTVPTDYVVVKSEGDELYIALDYIKEYTDLEYRFYEDPSRLLIWNEYPEKTYALLNKDTAIRFRGGIKSPIIADGQEGQEVEVLQDLEDWIEIRTEDGFMGYVSAKRVGETYTKTMESTYVESAAPVSTKVNFKINLVFQAIGTAAYGGENVEEALEETKGVNVISPTWYKLTSNNGDMSSFANKSYVEQCHSMGIQVWALVDDFDPNIDRLAILSNKETRARMINRLISEAREYGFDGINLDFEYITEDVSEHYLQFIRELSFECRKYGIILSTDNYAPASYNMYYNRKEQGYWLDYFIIMGYDEYWKGSEVAGPVASIGFVENGITNTLLEVPAEKVINAMPYYVRVWTQTLNTDGTTSMSTRDLSMEGAANRLKENGVDLVWDEEKGVYYGSYESGKETVQIWLEDEKTIEEKMKLYKANNLAGVAGWKLGLEKKEVWSVIENYLN